MPGNAFGGPLLRKLLVKAAYELGPTLLFFLVFESWGFVPATACFMAAAVLSVAISRAREGKLPVVPLISAGIVLLLGGATLAFDSETFVKMRPTIINGLFALALLGMRASGRDLVRDALSPELRLTDQGWLALNARTVAFLLGLAALNEVIRLGFSTEVWVAFKAFGILPLDVLFVLAQLPLVRRHRLPPLAAATKD